MVTTHLIFKHLEYGLLISCSLLLVPMAQAAREDSPTLEGQRLFFTEQERQELDRGISGKSSDNSGLPSGQSVNDTAGNFTENTALDLPGRSTVRREMPRDNSPETSIRFDAVIGSVDGFHVLVNGLPCTRSRRVNGSSESGDRVVYCRHLQYGQYGLRISGSGDVLVISKAEQELRRLSVGEGL